MVTVNFYLDNRRKKSTSYSLRINLSKNRKTSSIPLGIQLLDNQWDVENKKIINHPEDKFWNNFISRKKIEIETLLLKLEDDPNFKLGEKSIIELRDYINNIIFPERSEPIKKEKEIEKGFLYYFGHFIERKSGRTKAIYEATKNRLIECFGEKNLSKLKFEDIKVSWLEDFNDWLAKTNKINSISIHMRNVRAVVNYAIDNDVTTYYAFRRFKIKNEPTRKRNFDVETLRKIFRHQCDEKWQIKYLDFFKLTFMLIGINVVDLCTLKNISQGRIEYIRAKTHRPYSIKVEKEVKELIEKYKGENYLLNYMESYQNYRHFYNNLCKGLSSIKEQLGIEELTTYWARHSWATIARKLRIHKDVIAQALGHGGKTVTDIYIDEDMSPVDEANRKVLDYVLYGDQGKPKRGRPRKNKD